MSLSRDELIDLVDLLRDPTMWRKADFDAMVARLEAELPDPQVVSYLFSVRYHLSPEQVVEKALSYCPISLPSAN
jgi:hypothetical protein